MVFLLVLSFATTTFAWGDSNLPFRKPIDFTGNTVELTNYAIPFNISYDADMNSDFSDLRFYDSSDVKLDYWIEEKVDGDWAKVYVEFNTIPTGDSTFYVNYGNASYTSESNATATVYFYNDFSTTTNWIESGNTADFTYSSIGGELDMYYNGNANVGKLAGVVYTAQTYNISESGFKIEIQNRPIDNTPDANDLLYFGLVNSTTQVMFDGQNSVFLLDYVSANSLRAGFETGGTTNITSTSFSESLGVNYTYDLSFDSTQISSVVPTNGGSTTTVENPYDITFDKSSQNLYLVIGMYNDGNAGTGDSFRSRTDYVLTTKYDEDEPTGVVGSEENFDSTAPTIENHTITFNGTDLFGTANVTDETALDTVSYQWWKNDVAFSTNQNITITVAENATYVQQITANDTTGNTNTSNQTYVVELYAPVITGHTISVVSGDYVSNYTPTDPQGTDLTFTKRWYVNDVLVLSGTDTLPDNYVDDYLGGTIVNQVIATNYHGFSTESNVTYVQEPTQITGTLVELGTGTGSFLDNAIPSIVRFFLYIAVAGSLVGLIVGVFSGIGRKK